MPELRDVGSSPCVRGTFSINDSSEYIFRFIPVRTGNIHQIPLALIQISVHPRAYGEHHGIIGNNTGVNGSSPCVRGTYKLGLTKRDVRRFIPVRTGNIECNTGKSPLQTVHPRAYGEHQSVICDRIQYFGSSPCVRGTSLPRKIQLLQTRFIPVRTGNILSGCICAVSLSVHPRAYGEHN